MDTPNNISTTKIVNLFSRGRMHIPVDVPLEQKVTIIFSKLVAKTFKKGELDLKILPPLTLKYDIHPLDTTAHIKLKCCWLPKQFLDSVFNKLCVSYVPNEEHEFMLERWKECLRKELQKFVEIVLQYEYQKYAPGEVVELMNFKEKEEGLPYYFAWMRKHDYPMLTEKNDQSYCKSCNRSSTYAPMEKVPEEVTPEEVTFFSFFRELLTHEMDKIGFDYGVFENKLPELVESTPALLHICNICFLEVPRESCVKLDCRDIFCKECLENYLKSKMADKNIIKIPCPQWKCESQMNNMVYTILDTPSFEQFMKLVLEIRVTLNPSQHWCIRCRGVAHLMKEGSNAFRCSSCRYEFCNQCEKKYHGDVECSLDLEEKLIQRYLNATVTQKLKMVHRYSIGTLTNWLHNVESRKFIQASYKACPKCGIMIELGHGCNHVRCQRCSTDFCYECLRVRDDNSHEVRREIRRQSSFDIADDTITNDYTYDRSFPLREYMPNSVGGVNVYVHMEMNPEIEHDRRRTTEVAGRRSSTPDLNEGMNRMVVQNMRYNVNIKEGVGNSTELRDLKNDLENLKHDVKRMVGHDTRDTTTVGEIENHNEGGLNMDMNKMIRNDTRNTVQIRNGTDNHDDVEKEMNRIFGHSIRETTKIGNGSNNHDNVDKEVKGMVGYSIKNAVKIKNGGGSQEDTDTDSEMVGYSIRNTVKITEEANNHVGLQMLSDQMAGSSTWDATELKDRKNNYKDFKMGMYRKGRYGTMNSAKQEANVNNSRDSNMGMDRMVGHYIRNPIGIRDRMRDINKDLNKNVGGDTKNKQK